MGRVEAEELRELLKEAERLVPKESRWVHVRQGDMAAYVVNHTVLAMPPEGEEWDATIGVCYVHDTDGGQGPVWCRPIGSFRARYVRVG